MKKLYEKDPVWFAVLWIVIYVIGFSTADSFSEAIGIPKLLTAVLGILLSIFLYGFIRREGLCLHFGLCAFRGNYRGFAYFLPLILITSVNLWHGVIWRENLRNVILYIISMCCVGFLEEVIFRGFLFKGMFRSNGKAAIIVSSLTFGVGHIVNLLTGEPLLETLLQLVYASAIGFCYTCVFFTSGSILPCILSHALVNSTSIFAREPDTGTQLIVALIQTILGVSYGLWLLRKHTEHLTTEKNPL